MEIDGDCMKDESGQVILILLLVMTVALGIGLSIIQRSLSDVSTSTQVEQSSRAFSAAEAGIERALGGDSSVYSIGVNLPDTGSSATVSESGSLPVPLQGLEYQKIGKEEIAHFWLANPYSGTNPPAAFYTGDSLYVYWGSPNTERAAIEITIVYWNGSSYQAYKYFYDPDQTRAVLNGFCTTSGSCTIPYSLPVLPTCSDTLPTVTTSSGPNRSFYCKTTISGLPASPSILMVLRTRLLYTSTAQPVAVVPASGLSLPGQAHLYTSIGTSGSTQRTVQLFTEDKVVPFYFDYAIFSAGPITK